MTITAWKTIKPRLITLDANELPPLEFFFKSLARIMEPLKALYRLALYPRPPWFVFRKLDTTDATWYMIVFGVFASFHLFLLCAPYCWFFLLNITSALSCGFSLSLEWILTRTAFSFLTNHTVTFYFQSVVSIFLQNLNNASFSSINARTEHV
jgi:hypothetical protein